MSPPPINQTFLLVLYFTRFANALMLPLTNSTPAGTDVGGGCREKPKHHDGSKLLSHVGSLTRHTKPDDLLLHHVGNISPHEANHFLVLAASVRVL